MKIGLLIGGLIIGLVSCKPTDFVGQYELRHFPKTSIELRSDGTFEFTKINPNPYLHPLDHPDEYYFTTTGQWKLMNNRLLLNSFKDSLKSRPPGETFVEVVLHQRRYAAESALSVFAVANLFSGALIGILGGLYFLIKAF